MFVHDLQTGTTTRVSVDSLGAQANSSSVDSSISDDGCYVSFTSYASNLVAGDANNVGDIFRHDRQTGATIRVSVGPGGVEGDAYSIDSECSADGQLVVFNSVASNLVLSDTNGVGDEFVHEVLTGLTTRVSVSSSGVQGNGHSSQPSVSPDGRHVAFGSSANNLVLVDTWWWHDIFVHDRQTGVTTMVSMDSANVQAYGLSFDPSASTNGEFISFSTGAMMVPGDHGNVQDIYLRGSDPGRAYLSMYGSCPGTIDFTIWNGTPKSAVIVLTGVAGGSYTRTGAQCNGLTVNLGSPVVLDNLILNASGMKLFSRSVPLGWCGRPLQVVDVATCRTSVVRFL